MRRLFFALLLLAGCPWVGPDELAERLAYPDRDRPTREDTAAVGADVDGDGFVAEADGGLDCDDARANVNPNAPEVCDGLDNDCNGATDDDAVDGYSWYPDGDADGFGRDDGMVTSCASPQGYAAYGGDCDDADAAFHPGAPETDCADPNDYNCDGSTGEDDRDGDGWIACLECNDASAAAYPGATELCDEIDDDCDGAIDEADAADATAWYTDADVDGYGDPASVQTACERPLGLVADGTDCNDADSTVNPGGLERCSGPGDEDCDGEVDEKGADGCAVWYYDADGDGHGTSDDACYCVATGAYRATTADDCDDGEPLAWTGNAEVCDGVDNDCDGTADQDATGATTWYRDADADGYGDSAASLNACTQPSGYVSAGGDCDDTSAAYNPGATESCSGTVDYNCDGSVGRTDADGDGWAACEECNDGDASAYPGATETCDGVDDDCDGTADDDATDATTWYYDGDGDGYGTSGTTTRACSAPSRYVSNASDCDDASAAASPAGSETCGGGDEDCDGTTDEAGSSGCGTWYYDGDGDGYGTSSSACLCAGSSPYTATNASDCDDGNASAYGGATESCDGVDNNCDGSTDPAGSSGCGTYYYDGDGDGYGSSASACLCSPGSGYTVTNASDCHDGYASISPGATEVCDGSDNNCDGSVDGAGSSGCSTYYHDGDGDGYGGSSTACLCSASSGYVTNTSDCDDSTSSISPGATEYCDGYDNDCDGDTDPSYTADCVGGWYRDMDDDGYGQDWEICACPGGGWGSWDVTNNDDCDDYDADTYPGATEYCDGQDDDCDGSTDDTCI
ncbi:MAG: putative metal-binding motif-containing protein [Myxococcota bacterium]